MKIAIDGACWRNRRGFGRFTRELIAAMAAAKGDCELVVLADSETVAEAQFPNGVDVCEVRVSQSPIEAASADSSRSVLDLWRFRQAVSRLKPDAVFFPAVYTYFPVPSDIPTLVAVHDVIADTRPDLIFPTNRGRWLWNQKMRLALRGSPRIATVSENAKRRIAETFRRDPEAICVIGQGVHERFHPRSAQEKGSALRTLGLASRGPLLLYVGGLSPHKNLTTLVRALRLLADRSPRDWTMVFVGETERDSFHSAHDEIRSAISDSSLEDRVVFTGYVSDETLAALYGAARLLTLPSLDEGFGLPAAEAMACGTPVAASNAGALPEVVGDAGLLFDPLDPSAIADVLDRLLADAALHSHCTRAGVERAAAHRWSAVAEKVFSELDRVVAARR